MINSNPRLGGRDRIFWILWNIVGHLVFVSGKWKDARPKHFKLGKTVNSYGAKLSKKR